METKQPETLRIADDLRHSIAHYGREDAFTLNAYDAEKRLRSLHTENETLRTELVSEAKRTANEKLRADQLTQQHRMQADLHTSAREELAVLRTGYDAARLENASLQAQLEAIGAGGVEPLRKWECLHQISEPASGEAERAAFVAYLTEKFPTVYSEGAAEHWWDKGHVSALAWQGRAALAAQAQPAAQALDAIVDLAQEAHRHWDADRDAKVGKLLMALSGYLPGYDKRADALHAAIAAKKGEKP